MLLHGLGASAEDLAPIVPHLKRPDLLFVLPTAPVRRVTINAGWPMPAWYDITTMDRSDPHREPPEHIRAAAAAVEALMASEGPSRWVVAGFSQGGAIALHLAWRHAEPLLGVMALSTYLVIEDTLDAEFNPANAATPALFCHGSLDEMVPMERGRAAFERWNTDERSCQWFDWPMGHEVNLSELRSIAAMWISCDT